MTALPTGSLVCGMKLTHDGGLAVVDGNRLVVSVEAEKLENRQRHAAMNRSADLARQLTDLGLTAGDVRTCVDGWARGARNETWVEVYDDRGTPHPVEVAGYHDDPGASDLLTGVEGAAPLLGAQVTGFRSFSHGTDHAMAAYATSPFAASQHPSLVVVWDGGMIPMIYLADPRVGRLDCIGAVGRISGALFPIFSSHFDAFRLNHVARMSEDRGPGLEALLPIAGKAMAYAALAPVSEPAVAIMRAATGEFDVIDAAIPAYLWSRRVIQRTASLQLPDPALIGSLQEFLYRHLSEALDSLLLTRPHLQGLPICLSGGCALNIKWNSALRSSGRFPAVWVPPFPNDSGSAIGAACAEMARGGAGWALEWSVFAGPDAVRTGTPVPGWTASACEIEELAKILEAEGEPVAVVDGPAELGPRALGHRSIIAPATSPRMKNRLNEIKHRESYRPVAPICLVHRAPEIFDPGTEDPYMLFDHRIRPVWLDRIPAVAHVDESARLQTVGPDNDLMWRLLTAYEELTGVPVLCNTSANLKGSGFFPDAESAMRWGGVRRVWSDGTLYTADERQAPG